MKGLSKWLVTRTPVSRVERLVVAAAVAVLLTVEPACGPAIVKALAGPAAAAAPPPVKPGS